MAKVTGGRNVAQESVRELISREQWDLWAAATWEIATSGVRPEWAECPRCQRKVKLDRVDLMARVNAGKELQAMGFGKPRDDAASERGFLLKRVVVEPGGREFDGVSG